MKNWKWFNVLGIVIVFVMFFVFVGCDKDNGDEQPEFPEFRESMIVFDFVDDLGINCSAKVQGTLLSIEWDGVLEEIKGIINNEYSTRGPATKNRYEIVFSPSFNENVTIIVEKTSEYNVYKVINIETLFLNVDNINKLPDPSIYTDGYGSKIGRAVGFMDNNTTGME